MNALKTENMSKSYLVGDQQVEILHSINLSFSHEEFCGIIGPSGSGKTTLLYTLSGLELPSQGHVYLLGKDTFGMNVQDIEEVRSSQIAFVFQFYNLLPNLTVFENIHVARMFSKKEDKEEIEDVLAAVGMLDFKDYYPNQLSGGMQQRVAIARSLVNRPQIIFADEPTGNLDILTGKEIMDLLKKIQVERKVTVIMVTHNPDYLSYCTRKIVLKDGRVDTDEFL